MKLQTCVTVDGLPKTTEFVIVTFDEQCQKTKYRPELCAACWQFTVRKNQDVVVE